jgi:hypothetical protein
VCPSRLDVDRAKRNHDEMTGQIRAMNQHPSTSRAEAHIEVSDWRPEPIDADAESDGPQLIRIAVRESFTGDITATGHAAMLQVLAADGSASFVAIERIAGTLDGRSGSFVLQDHGTLDADGTVAGEWFVVTGSGTGELAGLSGSGGFSAAVGQHATAWLDYTLT